MRHLALVAVEVGLAEHHRPLDAHVLVRRRLGLHAEARTSRPAQHLGLARSAADHHADPSVRRVGIPDGYGQRPPTFVGHTQDADAGLPQKCFTFRLAHGQGHRSPPSHGSSYDAGRMLANVSSSVNIGLKLVASMNRFPETVHGYLM